MVSDLNRMTFSLLAVDQADWDGRIVRDLSVTNLAVFHFVRQQYGWVALYRSRGREKSQFGWWVDTIAIYMATVLSLIHISEPTRPY